MAKLDDEAQGGISPFVVALAEVLLEEVDILEEAAGRVTDLMAKAGGGQPELVMSIQSFDRLKQEFEAIGNALLSCGAGANALNSPIERDVSQDILAGISVSALRDRLVRRLQSNGSPHHRRSEDGDIGHDVEF